MRRALRDFYDKAASADIAVVYYAGHGIEVDGTNYMIPVDAVLKRDRDVDDEAVSLDRILETVEQAKQLRLIILDACRDNPFAKTMIRTGAARALTTRGLITVEPTTLEHADRLCREGRLDGGRRQQRPQPVHQRAAHAPHRRRASMSARRSARCATMS